MGQDGQSVTKVRGAQHNPESPHPMAPVAAKLLHRHHSDPEREGV